MQETMTVSVFLQSCIKLDGLVSELTDFMHKDVTNMDMLQIQFNMLYLGHLSPSTIPSNEFRKLLVGIQSHLRFYLELPSYPEEIWGISITYFHATLSWMGLRFVKYYRYHYLMLMLNSRYLVFIICL